MESSNKAKKKNSQAVSCIEPKKKEIVIPALKLIQSHMC